jgi:hypothetical protein
VAALDRPGARNTLARMTLARMQATVPGPDSGSSDDAAPGVDIGALLAAQRALFVEAAARRAAEPHAGDQGCPVRATAAAWRDTLRSSGLDAEADAADEVVRGLDVARLRATLHHAERGRDADDAERGRDADDAERGSNAAETERASDADAVPAEQLFDALLCVEELLLVYQALPRGLGTEPGRVDNSAVVAEGRAAREALRRRLAHAVADGVVGAARRVHFVELAIDAADDALFAAGEVPPAAAAERLERAAAGLDWHAEHLCASHDEALRRRLRRARGRLESERQEQVLTASLQRRFGARNVARWDRAVLLAILAVLGLLAVDLVYGVSRWSMVVEHTLCAFFLWDFTFRAFSIGFQRRWLARHFVTDFLPALPWTWLLGGLAASSAAAGSVGGAEAARGGLLLRLLRLPRMAQTLRLLMPLTRIVRAVGFLARGLDRLVRSNGRLLEQEVLLFPTSEERRAAFERAEASRTTGPELHSDVDTRFNEALARAVPDERVVLARARNAALLAASHARDEHGCSLAQVDALGRPGGRTPRRAERPLAEALLARLERVTGPEVEASLGEGGTRRAARGVRLFVRSPLRYLPIARHWVPRESLTRPDADVVAGAARSIARGLGRQHARVLWWADLATTITPAELVGRVGATIVAGTARPAVRLLLFAGLYGLLYGLLQLVGKFGYVEQLAAFAERMIGKPLLVLGTVCLALLAVGAWLQRLARDASTFQEQVAAAQFLHLTDSIKARHRSADARFLARRVFAPELALQQELDRSSAAESDSNAALAVATEAAASRFEACLASFMGEGAEVAAVGSGHDPVGRAVLLYRDHQAGAMLVDTDTRATSQLLGNLALRQLIDRSGRLTADDLAALARIDLVRRKSLARGPYLWFHAITRALASRAARAIVDFNANAIPERDLSLCTPEELEIYEAWLLQRRASRTREGAGARQVTTAFTVLHFLDTSAARDAEVQRCFGPRVRERLVRERRELVRSVLGCWPLAYRPLEERVLNLRAFYDRWLAGGRVLFLPVTLAWRGARAGVFLMGRLLEAVQAIRDPDRPLGASRPRQADFATALRKIDRMRLPAAWEALRLRARFDPQYLGFDTLRADGASVEVGSEAAPRELERDLAFVRAEAALLDEVELLRLRTRRDLEWLRRALDAGLRARLDTLLGIELARDPERSRALALAFHADLDGVRACLAGEAVIVGATQEVLETSLGPRWLVRPGLRRRVLRWLDTNAPSALHAARLDPAPRSSGVELPVAERKRRRRAVWTAISRDLDGARAAFEAIEGGADVAAREGEALLAALLRHPAQLTEQLTTLRTIQATTLLDVRNYRAHVHRLGQYEPEDPWREWSALLEL